MKSHGGVGGCVWVSVTRLSEVTLRYAGILSGECSIFEVISL